MNLRTSRTLLKKLNKSIPF